MALRGGLQTESGCVGVEGVRLVEEALRSGCRIEAVLFSESGERHHERLAPFVDRPEMAFPLLRTTDRLFEGLADTEHPQGVAALVAPRAATLDDILRVHGEACSPLLVVLAGVQDPGQRGDDLAYRVSIWRDRRGHDGFGTKWNCQPLFAEGAACFRGGCVASADTRRDVFANFADAASRCECAYTCFQRAQSSRGRLAAARALGSKLVRAGSSSRRQRRSRLAGRSGAQRGRAHTHSHGQRHRITKRGSGGGGPVLRSGAAAKSLPSGNNKSLSLFSKLPQPVEPDVPLAHQPLAERMRPRTLDEFIGQEKLLGPGKPLRVQIENDDLGSMLFWGPPGCGKTTLARLIARLTSSEFVSFSAVLAGIKEIKDVMAAAERKARSGPRTIVFVDEVHRFNKAQQDAFLPYVEAGHITFIGATTENPSFEVISPLLSRTKVYILDPLPTPLDRRTLAPGARSTRNVA